MTHDLSHENNFKPWLDNYLNNANVGVVEKLDNINKEVLEIIDKFSTNIVDEE